MRKDRIISPIGLKGNQINERMKQLMNIQPLNENESKIVVELTKMGPDGRAYAIVRENHEHYIKVTDKTSGLVAEDFKYIGGLQNKKQEAYPSYAKAIKHLNLRFNSLAESFNAPHDINVFLDDNLLSESGIATFSSYNGNGFTNEGNLEDNDPLFEEENVNEDWGTEPYYGEVPGRKSKDWDSDDAEDEEDDSVDESLSEEHQAVQDMLEEEDDVVVEEDDVLEETINEHRLSISRAIDKMDSLIDSLSGSKKKVQ